MELLVTGRRVAVSDSFREHMDERLAKLDQLVSPDARVDVVVTKEGPGDGVIVIELTLHGRGPVVRSEAADVDKYVAFDAAFAKLNERVHRALERKRTGRRRQVVPLVAPAPADVSQQPVPAPVDEAAARPEDLEDDGPDVVELANTPIEVRVKKHKADPMNIEQAVYEMEMVGHDFYLFTDADTGLPSVMYRRRGWSYGVVHLEPKTAGGAAPADERPVEATA